MLMITLGSVFLLAALALVVNKIITNRLALIRFKKLSRGLPMCPGDRLLGNHTTTLVLGKNSCEKFRVWHQEMGKTIGWLKGDKFCASTIDLDFIKTFVHTEPDVHLGRIHYDMPVEEFEKTIMLAAKDEWRILRRAIAPALVPNKFKTPNVIQEFEKSIEKLINSIDKQIATNDRHLFDVDNLINKFALELIFRCFYKQEGLIDFDDPNEPWTRSNDYGFEAAPSSSLMKFSMIFPVFRALVDWLILKFSPMGASRRKVIGFVELQAEQGLEARKQLKQLMGKAKKTGIKVDVDNFALQDGTRFKRNLIDHVIDQFIEDKLTKRQYVNNSVFLVAAGAKTVMDAMVHTIYLLSIHRNVQDKLRDSIMADGTESKYLEWVLKESLRLLPPAPLGCSRTIERDMKVGGGYIVPAGTFVLTCSYVIHRLKECWGEDAEEFKPDRWRDTSHHHSCQYIPFGAGLRACPGKMFAMYEMKMLFAALLIRYKFEGEPRDDAYKFDAPFWTYLLPSSPTKVRISKITGF